MATMETVSPSCRIPVGTAVCASLCCWRWRPIKPSLALVTSRPRKWAGVCCNATPRALSAHAPIRAQSSGAQGRTADAGNEEEKLKEEARECLRNLAESLVLPSGFLSKLPEDLKVDVNDAAFSLSSGPLREECGERVAELVMQLARSWELGDTQTAAAIADQVPELLELLPSDSKSNVALGNRLVDAGRYLASTGKYGNGELQKLSEALIAAGDALSKRSPLGSADGDRAVISKERSLKFGALQVQLTAQKAYIGATVGLAFGLLSWQLTSALQNLPENSLQYPNDNALLLASSLRGTLLTMGYSCTALSAMATAALLVLASQMGSDNETLKVAVFQQLGQDDMGTEAFP